MTEADITYLSSVMRVENVAYIGDGADPMSRAERRHKKRLVKKKVRKYWGCHGKDDPVIIGKKASAPKPTSSCLCCMNRRKIDGETRQERQIPT